MGLFIKQIRVTKERAKELEKNYKLVFVGINADGTATYDLYEKDKSNETDTNNRS